MVGGTNVTPQDSQSEPGCYERKTRATARTKAKTLYEGKRQKPSQVYVSLDNADTVIEGGPPGDPIHNKSRSGWPIPPSFGGVGEFATGYCSCTWKAFDHHPRLQTDWYSWAGSLRT